MVRPGDRSDMQGLHPGKQIKDIILYDVRCSKVVYGLYLGGVIHALFGVIPVDGQGTGTPWVVGTCAVERNPLPFARASRSLLDMLQKAFPLLDTYVCAENMKSICWHRWCGFEFEKQKIRLGRDDYYRAMRRAGNISTKENG